MKLRINKSSLLFICLLIFSILPTWFQIGGHIASSVLSLVLLLLLSLNKKNICLKYFKDTRIVWLWLLVRDIIYIAHGEYVRMITLTIAVLIIAIIVRKMVFDKRSFVRTIDVFIGFSFFICLIGIIEGLTNQNLFLLLNNSGVDITRNVERLGITRAIGFTTQTTHFALYAAMVSLITLYRISNLKRKNKIIRFLVVYITQVGCLMVTASRTAILCYLITIFVYLLGLGVRKFVKYLLVGLIALTVILLFGSSTFIGKTLFMVLGAILPGFSNLVSGVAAEEAANPFGDRFNLYLWVFENVRGHLLIGVGEGTAFAQEVTVHTSQYVYQATKSSIEVHYLYCLYHFGIIGMVSEIVLYFSNLKSAFKIRNKKLFENKVSFSFVTFLIILFNVIAMFGIMQGEEAYTLYIILFLWFNYRKIEDDENYKFSGMVEC